MMIMILPILVFGVALTSSLVRWPRTMSFLVYASFASGAHTLDPGTIISISHAKDLRWSQEPFIPQQNKGKVVYHNYTVYTDSDGYQRSRWLKRQFLPKAKYHTNLQRRGFYRWKKENERLIDWSEQWLWWAISRRGHYQFNVVPYCWEDLDTKIMLQGILDKAIDRWHTALGPRAGIRFMQHCEAICGPQGSLGSNRKAVLRIQYKRTGHSDAPLGCESRRADVNVLSFNLVQNNFQALSDNDQNYFTPVAAMVHEFGKDPILAIHELGKDPILAISELLTDFAGHVLGLLH